MKSEITLRPYRYQLLDDTECVVATADRLSDLAYAEALEYCRRPLFYDTKLKKCVPAPEKESH
jgi:hypothetical protein